MSIIQSIQKSVITKNIAVLLAVLILDPVAHFKTLKAAAGGPTQPEFSGFTAVSASNLVDPFTGNVGYSVPLFEIGGYPVTLSYSGDIGMEQDAGWVGLGWSLNVGSINRGLRGVPDDFNGTDKVKQWEKRRPNWSIEVDMQKVKSEMLLLQKTQKFDDSVKKTRTWGVSISYDNYQGLAIGGNWAKSQKDIFRFTPVTDTILSLESVKSMGLGGRMFDDGEVKLVSKAFKYYKSDFIKGSKFNFNLDYNSRSGLSVGANLPEIERRHANLLSVAGFFIGLPTSYSLNSMNGKLNAGILTGYGSSNSNVTYQPDFHFSPVFISPVSEYSSTTSNLLIDLSRPKGSNKRTISLDAKLSVSALKKNYSEFPMIGMLAQKNQPQILDQFVKAGQRIMTDVQEQAKYVDRHTTELPAGTVLADVFSISGAGIGGSFRISDNAVTVYGPAPMVSKPSLNGLYAKGEFGTLLGSSEVGLNLGVTMNRDKYGPLDDADFRNDLKELNPSVSKTNEPYQPVSFANDFEFIENQKPYVNSFGASGLAIFGVKGITANRQTVRKGHFHNRFLSAIFPVRDLAAGTYQTELAIDSEIKKGKRDARQQTITYMDAKTSSQHGFSPVIESYLTSASGEPIVAVGMNGNHEIQKTSILRYSSNGPRKQHHISEFTVLQPDGSRYYYGTPVYNYAQYDYEFNVSNELLHWQNNNEPASAINRRKGVVSYVNGDIESNHKGIDHYCKTRRIPAYPHAYLLNAVLSSDYVDKTGNGPSEDDIGNYVKINYAMIWGAVNAAEGTEQQGFRWRSLPMKDSADYTVGNKSDSQDDKGSFSYGSKEMWYLNSIETKDQIAVFFLRKRLDGFEVTGRDGQKLFDYSNAKTQYCLDKVMVFSKANFNKDGLNAEPLKVIHLQYSYDLCRNYPYNGKYRNASVFNPDNLLHPITGQAADFNRGGKLTLHKIWVTYGNQSVPTSAPYVFQYNSFNPGYVYRGSDRWGIRAELPATGGRLTSKSLFDNPYTSQDPATANANASAWMLTDITLPSGGTIHIEYESDQYGWVQDRKAQQMLNVVAIKDEPEYGAPQPTDNLLYENEDKFSGRDVKRRYLIVKKPAGVSGIKEIVDTDNLMYYSFQVRLGREELDDADSTYEDVNGFFEIEHAGDIEGTDYAYIKMRPEFAGIWSTSPIVRNALQQGMARAPFIFYPGSDAMRSRHTSSGNKLVSMLLGAIPEAIAMLTNKYQYFIARNFCKKVNLENCRIRVDVKDKKYGGGHRVKSVTVQDNWNAMTSGVENTAAYTMLYDYNHEDGHTSGVTSYEPAMGGDENPFFYPKTVYRKRSLSGKIKESERIRERNGIQPANLSYDVGPAAEDYFPSATVGYARVTVKTAYPNSAIRKHKTGYTVQEFYTARDFPTSSSASMLEKRNTRISGPSFKKRKGGDWELGMSANLTYSLASQGFLVELNDMHGKPKSNLVYTEDSKEPFSGSRYYYKVDGNGKLINTIDVIRENGRVEEIEAGLNIEPIILGSKSHRTTHVIKPALDVDIKGTMPLTSGSLQYSLSRRESKEITFTKIVRRSGIVDSVVVYDKGAATSTKNLAWDALTGQVILTSVKNEYGDMIYSLTKPAHWMYKGIQGAYQNIDAHVSLNFTNGEATLNPGVHKVALYPGDELIDSTGNDNKRYWVLGVDDINQKVSMIDKEGNPIADGVWKLRIVRSGFRNILGAGAETITLKELPIASVNNERVLRIPVDQVISGKGITFDDHRKVYENWSGCVYVSCSGYESEPGPGAPTPATITFSNDSCIFGAGSGWQQMPVLMGGGYPRTTVNPFTAGIMGVWKPFGDYAYHDKRNQYALRTQSESNSGYNANYTNTRTDGLIKNYLEFWYLNQNGWFSRTERDTANPWTWAETLQHTDELGNHTQSVNALDIFSTALYGHADRRLVIATGANARHQDMLFDGFEDLPMSVALGWLCANGQPVIQGDINAFQQYFGGKVHHWPVAQLLMQNNNAVTDQVSHTGWKSVRLSKGNTTVQFKPYGLGNESYAGYYSSYQLSDKDFISRFTPTIGKTYEVCFWVKEHTRNQLDFQIVDNGITTTPSPVGIPVIINGWKKLRFRFTPVSTNIRFEFNNLGKTGGTADEQSVFIDDIRVYPEKSAMQSFVYDYRNYRLMSTLDDNNFAVFFEYDEEGALVRKKVETERGVMTIEEKRNSLRR